MNAKSPRESEAVLADLMMPSQANGLRSPSIFGGVVMSMVDKCAALSAMKHSGGQATTLSVERILFKEPIHVGELVEIRSHVAHVGRTSMSVVADVYAEDLRTGKRRHTNACWLTFVHLGDDGKPAPVPPLKPETDADHRLHEVASRRRAQQLSERT
ncbi:MAG: acyl-CoA thioesterase [Gemmatimonadota bacterium]|nr:acyl-CoA thioesterase [Gemmatimonadota bacterium]